MWTDNRVGVWDAGSARLVWSRANETDVRRAAISPSGSLVAIVDKDSTLIVWDTTDGRERFHVAQPGISRIVFSSDGRRIAAGGEGELLHLWDMSSGKELVRLSLPGELGVLVFSSDGRRLVATSRLSDDPYAWGELAMWSADDWRQIGRLAAHPTGVWDMSFNRTGKILTTARGDKTVRLINAETGSELGRLAFEKNVVSTGLTLGDARLLVTMGDHGAPELWDVGQRRRLAALSDPGGVDGVDFDTEHRLVATNGIDGTYRIWDVDKGTELHRFKGGCCLSSDGRLYLGGEADVIEIRQVATDAVVSRLTFDKQPNFYRLSPDGTRLAVMNGSGIELWDTVKQSLIARFDPQHALGPPFEFSPDGKLLGTYGGGGVYLWDASTGRLIRQVSTGFATVIFSSDGRLLASAIKTQASYRSGILKQAAR
jgi:WD40 repeat protein